MNQNEYLKGLHALVDIENASIENLSDADGLLNLWNQLVQQCGLTKVGEVVHRFDNGGFTAVFCLTESHISIHTWPEYGRLTFDVFLSNYQNINDGHVETIVEATKAHFEGLTSVENHIHR